ncbi:hypothetical protein CTI12_AA145190 [Artemisia annua]|uniref:Uncharacterized protein n=1 Tax=Artemisia annua TaxID=35608 RepID=A0A2U1PJI1_ARTAN|nr:hypothetical protein CTI12_AA145190 [Artemisia annua]
MLAELSRRERDAKIKPDPDLDMYMKAAATKGQEASVVTDYTLKNLKAYCTKLEEDVLGLQKRTTKHGAKIKRLNLRVQYLEGQQRVGNEVVQQEQVVETNTSLAETAATSNVEEMAKVVHQDVSAATTNQISTAEVSTTEEVAKTVDEAEVETDEQVAFSLQENEEKKAHGELMLAIIDADEVLQARDAKLYEDKSLSKDDRLQRLADLKNARSQEVELADLLNARSEEVSCNVLQSQLGRNSRHIFVKHKLSGFILMMILRDWGQYEEMADPKEVDWHMHGLSTYMIGKDDFNLRRCGRKIDVKVIGHLAMKYSRCYWHFLTSIIDTGSYSWEISFVIPV